MPGGTLLQIMIGALALPVTAVATFIGTALFAKTPTDRSEACSDLIKKRINLIEKAIRPILMHTEERIAGETVRGGGITTTTFLQKQTVGYYLGGRSLEKDKQFQPLYLTQDIDRAKALIKELAQILGMEIKFGCKLKADYAGALTLLENKAPEKGVILKDKEFMSLTAALISPKGTFYDAGEAKKMCATLREKILANPSRIGQILSELEQMRNLGDELQEKHFGELAQNRQAEQAQFQVLESRCSELYTVSKAIGGSNRSFMGDENNLKNGTFEVRFSENKSYDCPRASDPNFISALPRICDRLFTEYRINIDGIRPLIICDHPDEMIDGFGITLSGVNIEQFFNLSDEAKDMLRGHFQNILSGTHPDIARLKEEGHSRAQVAHSH